MRFEVFALLLCSFVRNLIIISVTSETLNVVINEPSLDVIGDRSDDF